MHNVVPDAGPPGSPADSPCAPPEDALGRPWPSPAPMAKDICCENFKGLVAYIRRHFGEDGVHRLTAGLVDGRYYVRDKFHPERIVPIDLERLTDPACWVSNDLSLELLGRVREIVPGPNPLFSAGLGVTQENYAQTVLFAARLIGVQRLAHRAAKLNTRFNRTKDVRVAESTDSSLTFVLCYRPGYRVTKDVCNWNLGIYTGIGRLAGLRGVTSQETDCVLDGAPACRFRLAWSGRRSLGGLFRGLVHALMRKRAGELIDAYESTIAEREALIDRLEGSEKKYRTLFEQSPEAISLTHQGRLVDVNPAWLALHGYEDKAEVLGCDVADFVHPEDRPRLANRRVRWPHHAARLLSVRDLRRDGTSVHVEVHASPINTDGAESVLATVRDVSSLKAAEERRQMLEARLQRAEKMEALGTLAGGVAHDLNNILSGIVGYPDLMLMELPQDSPLREPVRVMQATGQKAAAIVQDLLTLARRGVSLREVLNLNQVVSSYLASPEHRKLRSDHPQVEVVTHLAPDLLHLKGSGLHLAKTVMNLIVNAAEAMPQGGRIEVRTSNRYVEAQRPGLEEVAEGEYCTLEVRDTGIGMTREEQEKVFEPFYTKKAMGRSGTGLGMAVVWGTIQDHAGFIRIESAPGQGTAVRLHFPATRESLAGGATVPPPTPKGRGERVLVVDDVPEQRELADKMLATLGYERALAASGEEALEVLQREPCDLVLLDMLMAPGMDGLETYRRIIQRHPGQKAVLASGFSEDRRVREAQALGAGAYLAKPYTLENLGRCVRAELDRGAPAGGRDDRSGGQGPLSSRRSP